MNLQARLEQAQKDKESIEVNIAEIKKQMEEPELRHGDYGYDICGRNCMAINVSRDGGNVDLRDTGQSRTHFVFRPNSKNHVETKLGNIFDDLKALSEDCEEFKVEVDNTPSTHGTITVGSAIVPPDLVYIAVSDDVGTQRSIHLTHDEFENFVIKCRQKLATIKRKEN